MWRRSWRDSLNADRSQGDGKRHEREVSVRGPGSERDRQTCAASESTTASVNRPSPGGTGTWQKGCRGSGETEAVGAAKVH